jgi:cell shape-determining protein MreC
MIRKRARGFLLPALVLLGCLSLPHSVSDALRGYTVASFAPLWKLSLDAWGLARAPFEFFSADRRSLSVNKKDQEIRRLQLENQLLTNEIQQLQKVVKQEHVLLREILDEKILEHISLDQLLRHEQEVLHLFKLELLQLPARVIFRPINAWNSSLWIDKGEADNKKLGRCVIAKNSPVVIGTSVVGVVDEVGQFQSCVRLITDSGLNPSVRVKRDALLLAKGEIQGENRPCFRSHQTLLKGVGFNYDFADEAGPARDLRTGEASDSSLPAIPLVKVSDLLVTTGMDGVFPPGLNVGIVRQILPLKEGDYTYSLEAETCAGNLDSLTTVFVLPPLSRE